MSYYHDKKIYDTYKISELYDSNNNIVNDIIEICNNEEFNIDLTSCTFKSNHEGVDNVELNKVIIDWGDGETTKLIRPIHHTLSTISNVKENSWKRATHVFNVNKRNVYFTNNVEFLPKIQLKLYSTFNDVVTILIPYKIVYKSLYDLGSNFELLQANVANNNLTQFVLKEGVNDSITIVSAKDWKKIYGNLNDINYIEDNKISIDYSDEYIDYDNIVWEWDSVPRVNIYGISVDTNNKSVTCNFSEKNVIIDDWTPYCERLLDDGDVPASSYIKRIENNSFECLFNDDITTSLFRIYLNSTGINGVTGNSDYFYAASSYAFGESITNLQLLTSSQPYKFKLSTGVQWKHFETAKMILKPVRWAASKSLYSTEIKDTGITNEDFNSSDYEESDITYSFDYDITQDGVIIDPFSLPNGKYSISYYIKDLLGNEKEEIDGNTIEHRIYVSEYEISNPSFDGLNLVDDINSEIINIKWFVTSDKQDKTVLKITNDDGVVVNIKEPYNLNSSIQYISPDKNKDNKHYYSYSVDGNTIPDGTYKVSVGNCFDMTKFVGCRQKTETATINYTYPSPKISINSINVFPKWNATYGKWIPYYRFNLNDDGRTLKNIKIAYGENESLEYILSQSLQHDIPVAELKELGSDNKNVCKIGAAFDSDLYSRNGFGENYNIKKNKEIDNLFTNKPSWVSDMIDLSKRYKNELTQVDNITGSEVQWESACDVNKKYVISHTEKIINTEGEEETITKKYYSPVADPIYYETDDKLILYVYRPVEYTDESDSTKVITRFFNDGSIIVEKNKTQSAEGEESKNENLTVEELESVKSYLGKKNIKIETSYDQNTDTSNVLLTCDGGNLGEPKEIQQAFLDLYNSTGNAIFRQDVSQKFKYEIPNMTPDVYTGKILFSSLKTSNIVSSETSLDEITYDVGEIDALVPPNQSLSASASSKKNINNDGYYDVVISYILHHKSFESLKLVYTIGDGEEESVGLNTIKSSSYELPEQIAPETTVKYHFLGISPMIKNGNSSSGVIVGEQMYEYTTPAKEIQS